MLAFGCTKEADDRYLTLQDEEWTIAQTWEGMEKVLASGKARAIGVSNFSQPFVEELLKTAKTVPAANQSQSSLLDASPRRSLRR